MTIHSFEVPLWVICTTGTIVSLWLYLICGALVAAICKRCGVDEMDCDAAWALWPFVIVFWLLLRLPLWIYRTITGEKA